MSKQEEVFQASAQKLDVDALINSYSRRQFLQSTAVSLGLGGLVGTGAYTGVDYLGNKIADIVIAAEKEIRELAIDIESLSGKFIREVELQKEKIKEQYAEGKLSFFEDLGIATPEEIKETEEMLETIIENSDKFAEQYSFVERLREFKDRIDRKLITIDTAIESWEPQFLQDFNDKLRAISGMKSGKEGKKARAAFYKRLDDLCSIYDSCDDDLIAQSKVLERINKSLSSTDALLPEEKELYLFMKQEYAKEDGNKGSLRDFIKNYHKFEGGNTVLLKVRAYLGELENAYDTMQENGKYALRLQESLKKAIDLREKVRDLSPEEFEKEYGRQIKEEVDALKTAVSGVVKELKAKHYDIQTREDFINDGKYGMMLQELIEPAAITAGVIAGAYVFANNMASAFVARRQKVKAAKGAISDVVKQYNGLVDRYNGLLAEQTAQQPRNKGEQV